MQTFTIHVGHGRFLRSFGRNPLVRFSDRLETLVLSIAVVFVMAAVPIAGAVGTAVHDSRAKLYTEQAQHRHLVTATAAVDAEPTLRTHGATFEVLARWKVFGSNHVGTLQIPDMANAGGQVEVWVDDRGDQVAAPAPPSKAADEALGAAVLTWLTVAVCAGASCLLARRLLDRARYADWDHELVALSGGGRFRSEQ